MSRFSRSTGLAGDGEQGRCIVGGGRPTLCVPGFEDFSPHFSRYQAAWLRERNPGLEPGALGQWDLRPVT